MTNLMEMIDGEEVEMSDEDQSFILAIQSTNLNATQMATLRLKAQALLDKSDIVANRCFKSSIPFPSNWQTYVETLRSIVTSGTGVIPTQPDYPANT